MIKTYPYSSLGHVDHGWLDATHHFSFASYVNPQRTGFGHLKVINDDTIMPHKGFATHPHQDMEIITYVKSGAITHKDSYGNEGKTIAGDVQVMSAGSGIYHSEFNQEETPTTLYQIWIEPNQKGVKPTWNTHKFPKDREGSPLTLLVSGDGTAPLFIHQDAFIYAGIFKAGEASVHNLRKNAYVLASKGKFTLNDTLIHQGDGAEVCDVSELNIEALEDSELMIIEV